MRQKLAIIAQLCRLPTLCVLCNQFHRGPHAVCAFCTELIIPLDPGCLICAFPLFDCSLMICGQCIKKKPFFDRSYIAYQFKEPLRGLLHRFKYAHDLYLASFIAHLMAQAINEQCMPECLIPVPMHPKKLALKGFNQSVILTKILAKRFNVPYNTKACQKIINTLPQAHLDQKQRKKNLYLAFECAPLAYQHVAIVDDLLTTGETANELARTLKHAGVQTVDVWCCARAVMLDYGSS